MKRHQRDNHGCKRDMKDCPADNKPLLSDLDGMKTKQPGENGGNEQAEQCGLVFMAGLRAVDEDKHGREYTKPLVGVEVLPRFLAPAGAAQMSKSPLQYNKAENGKAG